MKSFYGVIRKHFEDRENIIVLKEAVMTCVPLALLETRFGQCWATRQCPVRLPEQQTRVFEDGSEIYFQVA